MAGKTGILKSVSGAISARLTFKPLVYGYANARVRAMRAGFVTKPMLTEMLAVGSVNGVIELLERTQYNEDLVPLSLKFRGEELVELALGASFGRFAQKLLRVTPLQGRGTIEALLARWDVRNMKTVLLGRKLGKNFDEIAPLLISTGTLPHEDMRKMMEARDSAEIYALLRATRFGQRMLGVSVGRVAALSPVRHMIGNGLDSAMEGIGRMLDAYYYYLAESSTLPSDRDSDELRRMLSSEADAKNLSTVLRLKNAGATPAELRRLIVPGGSIGAGRWAEMAEMEGVEGLLPVVGKKFHIATEIEKFRADRQISSIEIALEQRSARESLRAMRSKQMSLGVIVGALVLKEQEMNNIRKIVRGKALGLPQERIEQMIVSAE